METTPRLSATLEALAAQLAEMEAAHRRDQESRAAQTDRIACLEAELAALRTNPPRAPRPETAPKRRPLSRSTRAAADAQPGTAPASGRTSRRGVLGAAAKVAAATVAAGVLLHEQGAQTAHAAATETQTANGAGNVAIEGDGTSGADGIHGFSDIGTGVYGNSGSGYAVFGISATGTGVGGAISGDGIGVFGSTPSSTWSGVRGVNTSHMAGSVAVLGHSDDGIGGLGPGIGVKGETAGGYGVYGIATSGTGIGVYGIATSAAGTGVYGTAASGTGVSGYVSGGIGVGGGTFGGIGVQGTATSGSGRAVDGEGTGGATGVRGYSDSSYGAYGISTSGYGVLAQTISGSYALYAENVSNTAGTAAIGGDARDSSHNPGAGIGVQGTSGSGYGMVAHSVSGTALSAGSATGSAIVASSNGVGYGLYLTAPTGWAIGCNGRLRVIGAAVGTVTLAHGTTSKQVVSTACSGSSQVILTATSDPQVRIWAVAAPGAFTIHASTAPASDVTFSYFLIN